MEIEWSPEDDMIPLEKAKQKAKEITQKYPGLSVCGSLSLILIGLIKDRPVSDLDFECLEKDLPEGCKNNNTEGYTFLDNHSSLEGVPCNFFVTKNQPKIIEIEGIPISSLKLTMSRKFDYWRPKDRKDLGWCRGIKEDLVPINVGLINITSS